MKDIRTQIRKDFPLLERHDRGEIELHYLDNAATALKPRAVLDAVAAYDSEYPTNIHRGSYDMSERASQDYEDARKTVARFLGVSTSDTVFFTSGATASCNLFAQAYVRTLQPGDEILVTNLEHNSNLVPWQTLCKDHGVVLKYFPIRWNEDSIDLTPLETLLTPRTKLFTFTAVSNTLGLMLPIQTMIRMAKKKGILCCLDLAQAAPHMPVDLDAWGVDVAFFSGHKLFAPTGIGVLYIRKSLALTLVPSFVGGGMFSDLDRSTLHYSPFPEGFEAGTPPIAQAIGLAAAIRYIEGIGWETIQKLEEELKILFWKEVAPLEGMILALPLTVPHTSVFSFNLEGVHPHDVGTFCNDRHVSVRTGFHCTHLFLRESGIGPTVRASLAFYNIPEDIFALRDALKYTWEVFHG